MSIIIHKYVSFQLDQIGKYVLIFAILLSLWCGVWDVYDKENVLEI